MTCGECKHYEPARNPVTGRVLRSVAGRCAYPVQWPALPMAFMKDAWGPCDVQWPYRSGVWPRDGKGCTKWEQKKGKPK